MPELNTPCKPYKKSLDKDGYSRIFRGRKSFLAHRYFYEQKYGKIELPLDHLCRNRWCINTDHLEPVTVAENTRRGKSAKLNYSSVKEIKRLYSLKKYKQYELGSMFGVGQHQISRIVNNKRWGIA